MGAYTNKPIILYKTHTYTRTVPKIAIYLNSIATVDSVKREKGCRKQLLTGLQAATSAYSTSWCGVIGRAGSMTRPLACHPAQQSAHGDHADR